MNNLSQSIAAQRGAVACAQSLPPQAFRCEETRCDSKTRLGHYRFRLRGKCYRPLIIGGMGVAISTPKLALEAVRLGGIGHLSDAMLLAVVDKDHGTHFVRDKFSRYKDNVGARDKSQIRFDLDAVRQATYLHVQSALACKHGDGAMFINCMEKLTMCDAKSTLKARIEAAMDAGIDGVTLSAGLHLSTLSFIQHHPRFEHICLGIIVSSLRALKLFLKRAERIGRLPDYVIVEGPLAGGHLGFGADWRSYQLESIAVEVVQYLSSRRLDIAVIAAGGIFNGTDALRMLSLGCAAVQVATRFAITLESGLPTAVKQAYVRAKKSDIEVNTISPTGYPMRMLSSSPALRSTIPPNCEAYGYLLDNVGRCPYLEMFYQAQDERDAQTQRLTCLCTEMRRFRVWTCGETASRLKETLEVDNEGVYVLPSAADVFNDYLWH